MHYLCSLALVLALLPPLPLAAQPFSAVPLAHLVPPGHDYVLYAGSLDGVSDQRFASFFLPLFPQPALHQLFLDSRPRRFVAAGLQADFPVPAFLAADGSFPGPPASPPLVLRPPWSIVYRCVQPVPVCANVYDRVVVAPASAMLPAVLGGGLGAPSDLALFALEHVPADALGWIALRPDLTVVAGLARAEPGILPFLDNVSTNPIVVWPDAFPATRVYLVSRFPARSSAHLAAALIRTFVDQSGVPSISGLVSVESRGFDVHLQVEISVLDHVGILVP